MLGIGVANGKFGELLQGELPGQNKNFLVALPITRYSVAKFNILYNDEITYIYPQHKVKSALLVQKVMKYFGLSCGWKLTIDSELKEGKGFGSSTADMVAVARAMTQALEINLPIDVLLNFLKEIEPSDGVMYDGLVCFYHRNVILHSRLGYLSDLMIIGTDEGGTIDTVKFNKVARPYSSREKNEYAKLLNEMIIAIQEKNYKKIGNITTKSAIIHQSIQPKKNLLLFIYLCECVEALGVIVAHSGTYIGILLNKKDFKYLLKLSFIEMKMKEHSLVIEKFNTFTEAGKNLYQEERFARAGDV